MMLSAKSDSETSLAASSSSPSRSSKRTFYYVQSPPFHVPAISALSSSTSVIQPSPMDSPTHDSSSLGRHSRNSSASRFSGFRSSSSGRKNGRKWKSNEQECKVILEEGSLYDEMDDATSIRRCQALLGVFTLVVLFIFFCSIVWGASRPYKAQISVQLKEHYQLKKRQEMESVVVIEGRRVPLYGAGASLEATERGGKIPVKLRFEVQSRGDVVGTLSHHFFVHVSKSDENPVTIMLMKPKPNSKFSILFTFLLLLSLLIVVVRSSDVAVEAGSEEELDDLEQLLAVDEQLQEERPEQQSEAETVSKAQRIVVELNGDNTKRLIDGNEYVMVLGYAPWCARSAELMPRFAEAATDLKEIGSSVLMAKIDGERYSKVASQLEIKGFPTLLLFVNGTSQSYTGGFSSEEIVIWVQKKTGVPTIKLDTVDKASGFLKKHHTFIVGLFEKSEDSSGYDEFVKAASLDNEIQFVETSSSDVAKLLFPNPKTNNVFVGLVKTEVEKYTAYDGSLQAEKILEFLNSNKFPLVTKLTESNTVRVYASPVKLQVMVFSKSDDFGSLAQPLENIARKFISKLMLIYIDISNENLAMPFLTLFGIEDAKKTVVAAFDNNLNSKFLLESDPSPSNIEEFCFGLAHGTVSPYYKSQPIPDNQNASVVAVVGRTFDELVLKSSENVLLEVHTPWCINCEALSKQVEKLSKHFQGFENLVFARIDASANEHPKLTVDDYPTILLYKAGEKENPLKLSTKSSAKEMAVLINKELKSKDRSAKDEL
ncbi:unnamed protein product [Arabidopsis halleri]